MLKYKSVSFIVVIFCCIMTVAIMSILLSSCKKDSSKNETPSPTDTTVTLTPYTIYPPAHFPPIVVPDDNKPSIERIQLGRMLYYDPELSNDGRACASCHLQSKGFTTPVMYNNVMTVLPHVNLAWNSNFMWDGSKQGTMEDVMTFEVKDFFQTDLAKFNKNSKYKTLVKKYFGKDTITYKELAYSLAQFMRTQISGDTKYDRFVKGTASFTQAEQQGYQIFFTEKGDCFHCHVALLTTDNLFHNTGLDSIYSNEANKGYYNVTGNPADMGKFKTPNLRNVALRSRFMHDGRYQSLEEVIDFYDHGMHKISNLDPIMTKPGKVNGLKLSEMDKVNLIAFLNTFTDSTFLNNPDLKDPN
jgi:cytochrome c peroxidase